MSYYTYDGLGSVANVTSASGATHWTYSYEPFALTRTETPTASPPANLIKFTGEHLDPTGLYHLRARQYEPTVGRFLRPDPVAPGPESPFVSTYVYSSCRPTALVDRTALNGVRRHVPQRGCAHYARSAR